MWPSQDWYIVEDGAVSSEGILIQEFFGTWTIQIGNKVWKGQDPTDYEV